MAGDFRVGDWIVQPERLCMRLPGRTVHVTPKAMAVLEYLADADGRVVSRNDILDKVWPGAAVTDDVLTQCVVELRKAFNDSAHQPQYIETITRKGLRLIPDVKPVEAVKGRWSRWRAQGIAAIIVIALAGTFASLVDTPAPQNSQTAIAILPFTDLSPNQDRDQFAESLTEELINRLAQIDGLLVKGRFSASEFKDGERPPKEIGEALGVAYVLAGSVRWVEDDINIKSRLTDVSSGFVVWSDAFSRRVEGLVGVQQEIAEAVANTLSVKLGVGQVAALEGGTSNVEAYKEFLAGKAAFFGSKNDIFRSIEHFERATDLDPGFAIAWAELASALQVANMGNWGGKESLRLQERADIAMSRALDLAPNSLRVITLLAQKELHEHKYISARQILDKIRERFTEGEIPYPLPYADLALKTGMLRDAHAAIQSNMRIDREGPIVVNYLSHFNLIAGRPAAALDEMDRAWTSGTRSIWMENVAVPMALAADDRMEIEKWLQRAADAERDWYMGAKPVWEVMYDLLDDRDALLDYLSALQAGTTHNGLNAFIMFWALYLDDEELALRALPYMKSPWFMWNPLTRRIRNTEEFKRELIDLGVVDYWREYGWGDFCAPTQGEDFECS